MFSSAIFPATIFALICLITAVPLTYEQDMFMRFILAVKSAITS